MGAPRYLLRERTICELLQSLPRGRFLEVGYGGGEMLLTLSRMGFWGCGYDPSNAAHAEASRLLTRAGVDNIRLVTALSNMGLFDYVMLFEVVGYFTDPVAELVRYRSLLKPNGRVVFSFAGPNARYSAAVAGRMRTFSRAEMTHIAATAGLRMVTIRNYGYPLANLMRPYLNVYHRFRRGHVAAPGDTGLHHRRPLMRILGQLSNPVTLWPFLQLQRWFGDTDRGNGYVALATVAT